MSEGWKVLLPSLGWQGCWKKGEGVSARDIWLSSKPGLSGLLDMGERDEQVLPQVGLGTGDGSGDSQGEAATKADGGRTSAEPDELLEGGGGGPA